MGVPKLWGKGQDGNRGFVFSHVKTIYYNWASRILLKTKLDEMDALIEEKVAKAMMSNQQVNDINKVPTSALAYAMQQAITQNGNDIDTINGNLQPQNYVQGSLFTYAENQGIGISVFQISSEVTTDIPTNYGIGFILRSVGDDISIVLCSATDNKVYRNQRPWMQNWKGWETLVTNNDLQSLSSVYSPTFNGSPYATLDSAVQSYIDSLPNNADRIYFDTIDKNGRCVAIIQKYSNSNYASAIVFSYGLEAPRYYRKSAGTWQTPKDL